MRFVYWAVAVVCVILFVLGLTLFPVSIPADASAVTKNQVETWYLYLTIVAVIIGCVVGGLGAAMVERRLRHRPGESARAFHRRVAVRGLVTIVIAFGVTLVLLFALAFVQSSWQIGQLDRFFLIISQGRVLAPIGAALAVAAVAFAVLGRARAWGGRGALIPI